MWQNFRSPLLWDVFARLDLRIVSLLFWYVGLVPDLATLRDRATTNGRRLIFGVLSSAGGDRRAHWKHYEMAYLILAGLSTPLVLSVHTIVSFDLPVSVIPGCIRQSSRPTLSPRGVLPVAMVVTLMVIAHRPSNCCSPHRTNERARPIGRLMNTQPAFRPYPTFRPHSSFARFPTLLSLRSVCRCELFF